ncbi:hypothetical protein M758_6G009800 [Ceratodon purpureus]|uniref:Protein PHLOEM PROTEIN 2-LIKE A10 n=1 Tax=Ceratodon purpureus TaxID=3225 RepID=A0A8T0H8Q3_CERPU|nr:hypothetical protein KC19_6G011600 [Ceratodon purpureus]KAG0612202.1 hypothetical protein M758_6G009800 [Ceratodon purpureus]
MFTITRRRRNILLACGAVAAGGYVTYRVYHSRKRLRVFLFFESFSTLVEVLAAGSDSFALVLADLRSFLVSEEDEVPRSLKQLLKLARSPEAQESISAVTTAVSRGLLAALSSGGSVAPSIKFEERPRRLQSFRSSLSSPKGVGNFVEKNVIKLGDKDVHALEGGAGVAASSVDDRALSPDDDDNVEEFGRECEGVLDVDAWTNAGSVLDGVKAQVDSSIARGTKEALQAGLGVDYDSSGDEPEMHSGKRKGKGELVDRLAEKLFSESGKGFASAMVASASRSFVTSVIEHINTSNTSSRDEGVESGGGVVEGLVSFARSDDGKAVLMDWIQTFVGTAVSVYLDRTKDINTFDELAVSLEKPEHRGAITDLLSTVCEASTSSFVRTSHEVLTSSPTGSKQNSVPKVIVPSADLGELFHDTEDSEVFYDMGEQEPISPSYSPVKWKGKTIVGRSEPVPTNYIEQISNVLAVPSNRKLILDIAGTMTSSAVRSTIDVSLGKVSAALGGKGKEPASKDEIHEAPRRSGVGEKLQTVGDVTKAAMDKSVVLMTMCFAVCLHSVVGGVRMIQPF